jgi:hypothetical protein
MCSTSPGPAIASARTRSVAHPQRLLARRFFQRHRRRRAQRAQRFDAFAVARGIGRVLIVAQPLFAALHDVGQRRRHRHRRCRVDAAACGLESLGVARQAGVHADAAGADHRLVDVAAPGQPARAGQCAVEHGADHGAVAPCDRLQVEHQALLRGRCGRRPQSLVVEAAVAQRHLLGGGQDTVVGADQQRALRVDEAALDHAHAFEQLAGKHDIHPPGDRHQREHRLQPLRGRRVEEFDVVAGGSRALRHARHRGGLHRQPGAQRRIDDPLGEHAAAFAAERGDQDRGRCGHHAG